MGKIATALNHGEEWNLEKKGRMVVERLAWPNGHVPFMRAEKYGKIRKFVSFKNVGSVSAIPFYGDAGLRIKIIMYQHF